MKATMTKNVLYTNYGIRLTKQKTIAAAKDCIRHFGQGEKVRFTLYAFLDGNFPVATYDEIPFGDPWGKNQNTLLAILDKERLERPKARFQISANLYTDD